MYFWQSVSIFLLLYFSLPLASNLLCIFMEKKTKQNVCLLILLIYLDIPHLKELNYFQSNETLTSKIAANVLKYFENSLIMHIQKQSLWQNYTILSVSILCVSVLELSYSVHPWVIELVSFLANNLRCPIVEKRANISYYL